MIKMQLFNILDSLEVILRALIGFIDIAPNFRIIIWYMYDEFS